MIVTVDYDGTLDSPVVQKFVAKLIEHQDIDVWILTSRYDELHKHLYIDNPTNSDLYKVAEKMGVPKHKIIFTNRERKHKYLLNTGVLMHLDNDFEEVLEIEHYTNTISIYVLSDSWEDKVKRILYEEHIFLSQIKNSK